MPVFRSSSRAACCVIGLARGPGPVVAAALAVTLAFPACSPEPRAAGVPPQEAGATAVPGPQASPVPPDRAAAAVPARAPDVLPPLPPGTFPSARPPDVVLSAYEFAARHPEVLRHVPCFCGCERSGHADNEDCFVKARAADGQVTWDAHGAT